MKEYQLKNHDKTIARKESYSVILILDIKQILVFV